MHYLLQNVDLQNVDPQNLNAGLREVGGPERRVLVGADN